MIGRGTEVTERTEMAKGTEVAEGTEMAEGTEIAEGTEMARAARQRLLSDVNHIMFRGIGHMDLFFGDQDKERFLNTLQRFKEDEAIVIPAYCLMSNHVHLLLKASPEKIPLFLKQVEVSYAYYFNGVYGHVGHLFQNRYKSEAITGEKYFLSALRYILHNPEAAGICKWQLYHWSSAGCYVTGESDGLTDPSAALGIAGGPEELNRFLCESKEVQDIKLAEPTAHMRTVTDKSALEMIRRIGGVISPMDIQTMEKAVRNTLLRDLKQEGLTVRQLERLTGINRNIIQRAK